jgi:hypothetical protein
MNENFGVNKTLKSRKEGSARSKREERAGILIHKNNLFLTKNIGFISSAFVFVFLGIGIRERTPFPGLKFLRCFIAFGFWMKI